MQVEDGVVRGDQRGQLAGEPLLVIGRSGLRAHDTVEILVDEVEAALDGLAIDAGNYGQLAARDGQSAALELRDEALERQDAGLLLTVHTAQQQDARTGAGAEETNRVDQRERTAKATAWSRPWDKESFRPRTGLPLIFTEGRPSCPRLTEIAVSGTCALPRAL